MLSKHDLPPPMLKKGFGSGPKNRASRKSTRSPRAPTAQQQSALPSSGPAADDAITSHRLNQDYEVPKSEHKQKRKASTHLQPPPSRRKRTALSRKDQSHVRPKMNLPTQKEFPNLPPRLLEQPKARLHDATQGIASFKSSLSLVHADRMKCVVNCQISGRDPVAAVGEGSNKKEAENATYLHLIAKLNDCGIIKEIFGAPKMDSLDRETMKEERDAKVDIYNYAARYGAVPKFTIERGNSNRARTRRGIRKIMTVTVELPEQNIKVSGQASSIVMAEVATFIKFKQEAEKYHAAQGTDSLVVKDSSALNAGNARQFFEFVKMVLPATTVSVEAELVQEYRSLGISYRRAQVLVNGEPTGEAVMTGNKKQAEDLAHLTAAIALCGDNSELLRDFFKAGRSSSGDILKNVNPIDMPVDEDCVLLMRDTLLTARRMGLSDNDEGATVEQESETRKSSYRQHIGGPVQRQRRSIELGKAAERYASDPDLAELRKKREDLPMNQCRGKVLDIVHNNTYSIIIGATGSGKTTQVPQILLDEEIRRGVGGACKIICTQPRRIAATSVARRVAAERAEKLQDSIGYHVRFDSKLPWSGGSVLFCTTGILLQQLQTTPDELMDNTTHLIIDEVHERDMITDFLLIIVKKVMAKRMEEGKSVPKIVLMSATMDADLFASYFETATASGPKNCPTLSVPGRAFPVKEQYLESILNSLEKEYGVAKLRDMYVDRPTRDYVEVEKRFAKDNPSKAGQTPDTPQTQEDDFIIDWKKERMVSVDGETMVSTEKDDALVPVGLAATTIAHLARTTKDGAILAFFPGLNDLVGVDQWLRTSKPLGVDFNDSSKYKIFMLHSSIPTTQTEVFDPTPEGCRKIILGTNIAETSITIPDVQYVVDTGKSREKRYDQSKRITALQCTWVSKSNSKQRAGRAGRVQNGHYYALFSKARHHALRAVGLPEILRSDLQETCLDIKAQAFDSPIREFLSDAIEAPSPKAVDTAVTNLQALDALTEDERLTPLGRLLASLPVHPALGKMIVLGIIFRCLDPMLILGAAAEERSLFLNPLDNRRGANEARMSFVEGSGSDHIALLNAFRKARQVSETRGQRDQWDFCARNFIHLGAFKTIDSTVKQIQDVLVAAGLIRPTPSHERADFQYGAPALNENSHKVHVIKALALAGLHPNLAVATGGPCFRTPGERNTIIHPSSCNAIHVPGSGSDGPGLFPFGSLLSYSAMAKSVDGRSIYLRDTTETTPLMAALFGGRLHGSSTSARVLTMDGWLPFYVQSGDARARKTILEFRKGLERLLTRAFWVLSRKEPLSDDPVRKHFADGLVEVLDRDVSVAAKKTARRIGSRGSRGTAGRDGRLGTSKRSSVNGGPMMGESRPRGTGTGTATGESRPRGTGTGTATGESRPRGAGTGTATGESRPRAAGRWTDGRA